MRSRVMRVTVLMAFVALMLLMLTHIPKPAKQEAMDSVPQVTTTAICLTA